MTVAAFGAAITATIALARLTARTAFPGAGAAAGLAERSWCCAAGVAVADGAGSGEVAFGVDVPVVAAFADRGGRAVVVPAGVVHRGSPAAGATDHAAHSSLPR
jgi:hypothetical protein